MLGIQYGLFCSYIFFLRLTGDFDRCFLEFQVSNRRNRHPEGSFTNIFFVFPPHSCYHVSPLIVSHVGLCLPRRYRSICAARMYRALCEQGSLTEYAPYVQRKSNLSILTFPPRSDSPYPEGGLPFPNCSRRSVRSPLHFRTGAGTTTLSDRMAVEPFVFVEAEQVQADYYEYVPANASNSTLALPAKTRSRDTPYRLSWHPPADTSLPFYE